NINHLDPAVASFDFDYVFLTGVFTDISTGADNWVWDFGDGDSSTLQNPNHIYQSGGTYLVTLTISGICGTSTYMDSVTVGVVGIDEFNTINFSMFPNPTNGTVTITTPELISNATIDVLDATGRLISTTTMTGSVHNLENTNLESGIYFVRIRSNDKMSTKRLIVQ